MTTCEKPITLQAGDYCLTKDMTEEDYQAVAAAFMAAGASGKVQDYSFVIRSEFFGWSKRLGDIGHNPTTSSYFDRQLTIQQILSATNAKREPTITGWDKARGKDYTAISIHTPQ